MNPDTPNGPRWIRRKLTIRPEFHQTDLMGVVHNSVHFLWFEEGRLQILFEILPLEEAMALGVAMPVVENLCHYHRPVRLGDPLVLHTSHRIQPTYEGRLAFEHSLVHEKTKVEMASGRAVMTLVEHQSHTLLREWPAHVWQRYQNLKAF